MMATLPRLTVCLYLRGTQGDREIRTGLKQFYSRRENKERKSPLNLRKRRLSSSVFALLSFQ